jgi:RNA polymerase sigma-70 factor (ECF subfamily)
VIIEATDYEIIQRILRGEKDLYEVLVSRCSREIRIRANRVTPKGSSPEDVTQEAFVRAYFKLGDFKPDGDFKSWVYGFLRNIVGDLYRETSRKNEVHLEDLAEYISELAEEHPVEGEDNDFADRLRECMERMHRNSKKLLKMRYEGQKTGKEIAEQVGKSQFAVNMALMRIRAKLRDCIEARPEYGT